MTPPVVCNSLLSFPTSPSLVTNFCCRCHSGAITILNYLNMSINIWGLTETTRQLTGENEANSALLWHFYLNMYIIKLNIFQRMWSENKCLKTMLKWHGSFWTTLSNQIQFHLTLYYLCQTINLKICINCYFLVIIIQNWPQILVSIYFAITSNNVDMNNMHLLFQLLVSSCCTQFRNSNTWQLSEESMHVRSRSAR